MGRYKHHIDNVMVSLKFPKLPGIRFPEMCILVCACMFVCIFVAGVRYRESRMKHMDTNMRKTHLKTAISRLMSNILATMR